MEKEKAVRHTEAKVRKPVKKRPAGRHKKNSKKTVRRNLPDIRLIAGGVIVLLLFILLVFIFRGCGVSHKTPEKVVKSLIESYVKGSERKIRNCYGVKKADDNLQNEITSTIEYFKAHNPEKLKINDCGAIYEDGDYTYIYIVYELVLKDEQSYPCISTYMTQKKDGKYYVLPPSEISDELSMQAAEKYTDFMQTDAYKDYVTAYETFTKKNPGYEEKFKAKLSSE